MAEKRLKKPKKQVNLENITPKEEILQKLGVAIKTTRKKKGFTSSENFAFQMDISRSLFAKYESGSDLRVSTLFRIIEGMGMKVSDFFKAFDA